MVSTVDGLISGMDTTSLISQLMQIEAQGQTALKTRLTKQQSIQKAFQAINTKLAAIETAADALIPAAFTNAWNAVKATSSSTSVAATASSGAATGSVTFDVTALAKPNVLTATYASALSPVLEAGYSGIALRIGDKLETVNVTTNTPAGVASAINAAGIGVRAAAITTDQGTVLQLTATKTGTANAVSLAGFTALSGTVATVDSKVTIADGTSFTITGDFQKADGTFEAGKVATISFGDGLGTGETYSTAAAYQTALQTKIDTAMGSGYTAGTVRAAVTDQGGGVWKVELYSAKALVADGADLDTLPDASTFTVADGSVGGAAAAGLPQATSVTSTAEDVLTVSPVTAISATDAVVEVGTVGAGGYTVTSSSNTFTDVIGNVSFTVGKVEDGVTLTMTSDADSIATKVGAMVDAVNALLTEIKTDTAYNSETQKASVLTGNFMLRTFTDQALGKVSAGAGTGLGSLATYGIELTKDGTVTFDKSVFLAAFANDPAATQEAVSGTLATAYKNWADDTQTIVKNTIQNSESIVDDLNIKIDEWDIRLALRRENLQRQFSAMETALSTLSNQSSWLAGQINSLPSYSSGD